MRIGRAVLGFILGYLALMLLSFPLSLLVRGMAPDAAVLGGTVLVVDFILSLVVVALAGWAAVRIGGPFSAGALAVMILIATLAAPAPNWPRAASWTYALLSAAILVGLAIVSRSDERVTATTP